MAIPGEFKWPPVGRNQCPLTPTPVPILQKRPEPEPWTPGSTCTTITGTTRPQEDHPSVVSTTWLGRTTSEGLPSHGGAKKSPSVGSWRPGSTEPRRNTISNVFSGNELNLPENLSASAIRALVQVGYTNLNQLADTPITELKALSGVDPKAIRAIQAALQTNCLSLAWPRPAHAAAGGTFNSA